MPLATTLMRSVVCQRLLCQAIIFHFFLAVLTGSVAWAERPAAAGSDQRQTLRRDGAERRYLLRLPASSVLSAGAVPLVLVLHGGGGNAENAERMTGFTATARREGFIVAYPEGSSRFGQKLLTWNAGHCCGYAMERKVDDVGFIRSLIKQLLKQYPIDPQRVYVTGMSNGGMMTHRLGRELAGEVAAIAPVVATVFGDESKAGRPVSALMFNGMLDESVPYLGGPPGGRFNDAWDGTLAKPALDQGVYWAGTNGCAKESVSQDRGAYVHWQYSCPTGKAVELYLLKDSGHAWPGGQKGSRRGDAPGTAVNATELIWAFFAAHGKSR
jgi:polyhydroxybutyrate depolymerase